MTESQNDSVISTLMLDLNVRNQGLYSCKASNAHGVTVTPAARIGISFLDSKFILEPSNRHAARGETVAMDCIPPNGFPPPKVFWFKDNQLINTGPRHTVLPEGTLRIDRIDTSDAGDYFCSARGYHTNQNSTTAYLSIHSKPQFSITPASQEITANSNLVLNCLVMGEPRPLITWRREYFPLSHEKATLLESGALQISAVSPDDAGDYVCQAKSSNGVIEAVASVKVISSPAFVATPPQNVSLTEGNSVTVLCQASGSPSPRIRWFDRNTGLYILPGFSSPRKRICDMNSDALRFFNLQLRDNGYYECIASSTAGVTRSVFYLNVTPNQKLTPPSFGSLSPSQVYLPASSQNASLRCNTPSNNPGGKIIWYKYGALLNALEIHLDPKFVDTYANYTCKIVAPNGRSTEHTIQVLRANNYLSADALHLVPERPLFTSLEQNGLSVSLKWTRVASASSYRIAFMLQTIETSHDCTNSRTRIFEDAVWNFREETSNSMEISDLKPGASYWFEVRAISKNGISEGHLYPQLIHFEDKGKTVNHYPMLRKNEILPKFQEIEFSNMEISSLTATEIEISWEVKASNNMQGQIHGFEINAHSVPMSRCIASVDEEDPNYCSFSDRKINFPQAYYGDEMQQTKLVNLAVDENLEMDQKMTAVLGEMEPFSCYEVALRAFGNDPTFGLLQSRVSGSKLVLTRESLPGKAPEIEQIKWIYERDRPRGLQVAWKPPKQANGLVTSYTIYLLADQSNATKVLHVSKSRDLFCAVMSVVSNKRKPRAKGWMESINFKVSSNGDDKELGTSFELKEHLTLNEPYPSQM
ncbi:Roundabout, axon guidance receptor [Cichlidogyrus casuarinus]|uniref:Roundabout, axon guidance receptor n=1 Tax=Cichlidogyrus casuarinus TaxID=1844966 RepID=A0ABD2QKV2_9PLAT